VRESFRLRVHELPPLDVVVQFTGDTADAELRETLETFWAQLAADAGGSASEPR
jgi:hypothetical protein